MPLLALNLGRDPFDENSDRSDRKKRTTSKGDATTLDDVKADSCDARVIHARFARDEIIKPFGSALRASFREE